MKTNNKTRANIWEREAAKMLSLWVSNGGRKDIFWRTNSSGAKHSVTGEANHAGDIVAVDPEGAEFAERFHIEVKWRKVFDYADIPTVRKWIAVEGEKAKQLRKSLFMLIKGRGGGVYILTDAKTGKFKKWNIPLHDVEYLYCQGYVLYRVPPPLMRKDISRIIAKVGKSRNSKDKQLDKLLMAYSSGKIDRRTLEEKTGLWFGEILEELGKRGLQLPRVPKNVAQKMRNDFIRILGDVKKKK